MTTKIIKQNFASPKNGLLVERERERERDCFYLPETNQASNLSGWQFVKNGKSVAILATDFLLF